MVVTLPETTRDVGELLSLAHADEKAANRQCLVTIAENLRFLAKQPELLKWLERKTYKYTSPEIQNEIITIMALNVVRDIASSIQNARFFTLMADEVTDAANQTQVAICFRSVDDNFNCNEEFIGLYVVESIESDRIVHILKTR